MPQPDPCEAGYYECLGWAQTEEDIQACDAFYLMCTGNEPPPDPDPNPCDDCGIQYMECLGGVQSDEEVLACDENYQACLEMCNGVDPCQAQAENASPTR